MLLLRFVAFRSFFPFPSVLVYIVRATPGELRAGLFVGRKLIYIIFYRMGYCRRAAVLLLELFGHKG